jgi:hypothetical protein
VQRKVIPNRITLPFGFVIAVHRISPSEMADRLEEDLDEGNAAGFWDYDQMAIFIDKTLPIAKQRYIMAHEMVHAVNDWAHWCLNRGVSKSL